MADPTLPSPIRSWIQTQDWGTHHLRWHAERQWDLQLPAVQAQLAARGWSRAARQEGTAGNGRDFLFMHRAMLQILRDQFPANSSLFLGWVTPPTNPSDVNDPVPTASPALRPFSASMRTAIDHLTTNLASFTTEDELGLFIQTRLRPVPGNPRRFSPDATTGIHNYIHNRFSDESSPVNMGDPGVNLENARFWRLHGWIDRVWTQYRRLKGLSDTSPDYVSTLQAAKDAMLHHPGGHGMHTMSTFALEAATANNRLARESLSSEVRHPFRESLAGHLQRLMSSAPKIATKAELVEYLQVAIQVEHGTLPLYLSAMWSLNGDIADVHVETLYRIVLQEMLHFGIVCNVLKAIHERPLIAPPEATIPSFPGQIPGLDLSDLPTTDIGLEPFSTFGEDPKSRIKLFMRIEQPEHGDIDPLNVELAAIRKEAKAVPRFHTIGEFYDVIIQGVETLSAAGSITFAGTGQVTSGSSSLEQMKLITDKAEAIRQLKLIQQQGEGNDSSQASGSTEEELAHYYSFKEIVQEHRYKWVNGKPVLDETSTLAFPPADQVRQFVPAPPTGTQSQSFNIAYSQLLDILQYAWDTDPNALDNDAVDSMRLLTSEAMSLMETGYGPNFRYIPQSERSASPTSSGLALRTKSARAEFSVASSIMLLSTTSTTSTTPVPGYARIREILDNAVNGEDFGAHGPFWRSLTRDQFVVKSVFGRPLLLKNADGTFDAQGSNLIKALEGRPPFGRNMTPRPPGAILNRMPDGYPPVPQPTIDEIRAWIGAGCPDVAPAAASIIDTTSPATMSIDDYVRFWKAFDDVAMFEATEQVQADIGAFFTAADSWFAFARDPAQEANWAAAIAVTETAAAIRRLEQMQRETILQSFGIPARQEDLLTCWEKFGDDTLPDDPLRPVDVRHSMNGESMWFFWSAFTDAAIRFSATDSPVPLDFWQAISRCVLIGVLNDGVFRGRFPVVGFPNTTEGKQAIRTHATTLPADALGAELRTRLIDAGF